MGKKNHCYVEKTGKIAKKNKTFTKPLCLKTTVAIAYQKWKAISKFALCFCYVADGRLKLTFVCYKVHILVKYFLKEDSSYSCFLRYFFRVNLGLLNIWTELLSISFSWFSHMRREIGTQITPWGWIFWTIII